MRSRSRRPLLLSVAAAAVVCAASYLSYRVAIKLAVWPVAAEPDAIGMIGSIGFLFGAWGILLSVGGFGLTWWQLQRTRRAASAVAEAMVGLKREFNSFDVITEVRTARGYAEATQGHVISARWGDALASYNNARASLNKVVAVRGVLSEQNLERARDYISEALATCSSIERMQRDSSDFVSIDIINDKLRELDGFLIELEYSMKDAIRG